MLNKCRLSIKMFSAHKSKLQLYVIGCMTGVGTYLFAFDNFTRMVSRPQKRERVMWRAMCYREY